jgi:hypothetical protein
VPRTKTVSCLEIISEDIGFHQYSPYCGLSHTPSYMWMSLKPKKSMVYSFHVYFLLLTQLLSKKKLTTSTTSMFCNFWRTLSFSIINSLWDANYSNPLWCSDSFLFLWMDCFISVFFIFSSENDFLTVCDPVFLILDNKILSPFVLMHRYGHVAKCWHAQWERSDTEKMSIHCSFHWVCLN